MKFKTKVTSDFKPIEAMLRRLRSLESHNVEYGFFTEDQHNSGMSAAELAIILNEGTEDGKIPPRPFFDLQEDNYERKFEVESWWKRDVWQYLCGRGNIKQLLSEFGRIGTVEIHNAMAEPVWEENVEWWAERKEAINQRYTPPLFFTGELAILSRYKVNKG